MDLDELDCTALPDQFGPVGGGECIDGRDQPAAAILRQTVLDAGVGGAECVGLEPIAKVPTSVHLKLPRMWSITTIRKDPRNIGIADFRLGRFGTSWTIQTVGAP